MTSYNLIRPPPPLFSFNLDNYMKFKQTIILASNPWELLKARSTRSLNPASVSVLASKVRNFSARHKEIFKDLSSLLEFVITLVIIEINGANFAPIFF